MVDQPASCDPLQTWLVESTPATSQHQLIVQQPVSCQKLQTVMVESEHRQQQQAAGNYQLDMLTEPAAADSKQLDLSTGRQPLTEVLSATNANQSVDTDHRHKYSTDNWLQCTVCDRKFHESCAEAYGIVDDDVFTCKDCM